MVPIRKSLPDIEKKPRIAGLAGTFFFWLLFLVITTVFSLFTPKPVYKNVQIRLDSAQSQRAPAPAAPKESARTSEPAKAAPPSPALPAKAPASSAKSPQNTGAVAKTAAANSVPKKSTPAKTPVQETFKQEFFDPMEQFAKNTAKAQKKKADADIDWDSIPDNSSSASSSTASVPTAVKEVSALAGNAASAAKEPSSAVSASTEKASSSAEASSGTSAALKGIASQSKVKGTGLSPAATDTGSSQTDGNSDIRFTSGTGRRLLSNPKITLSQTAQKAMSGQAEMQITFTVRADGTVTDVVIPSYLPQTVRQEISLQISRWRFSSGTDSDTAIFNYRIKE